MNAKEININEYLTQPVLLHLEKLTGISPADVPIDDISLYSNLLSDAAGIPELGTVFMQVLISKTKAKSFDDLIKLFGLAHGAGTWNDNADGLIESGHRSLSEVIADREDIISYLEENGIDADKVQDITKQIYRGEVHENGFDSETEKLLREHSVPDWFIESCKKIKYLLPRAKALSNLNIAVRLGWFKVYHPLAFYAVTFQAMERAISEVRRNVQTQIELLEKKPNRTEEDELVIEAYRCHDDGSVELEQLKNEYRCLGFDFLPPELGKSRAEVYTIEGDKLRLPYITIDGIGPNFARRLEEKAESKESYASLQDLQKKLGTSPLYVDALDEAGLLSGIGE